MKRKFVTIAALFTLCLATLVAAVNSGQAQRTDSVAARSEGAASGIPSPHKMPLSKSAKVPVAAKVPVNAQVAAQTQVVEPVAQVSAPQVVQNVSPFSTNCAIQPGVKGGDALMPDRAALVPTAMTLDRFRRLQPPQLKQGDPTSVGLAMDYMPREVIALIDPTNYGDRFLRDINGNPVTNEPIVVLHETVASAAGTVDFFRTPHPREEDQASYHTLISRNGTIIYLVPPEKRAFGAGNSVFLGDRGPEAVKTHPRFSASVNNFAYHVSLETPDDGMNNAPTHSGYTDAQYQSLAWLVAKTGVPDNRITTHKAVDRSASRMDPRSFQFSYFFKLLQRYPRTADIPMRCTIPPEATQVKAPRVLSQTARLASTPGTTRQQAE